MDRDSYYCGFFFGFIHGVVCCLAYTILLNQLIANDARVHQHPHEVYHPEDILPVPANEYYSSLVRLVLDNQSRDTSRSEIGDVRDLLKRVKISDIPVNQNKFEHSINTKKLTFGGTSATRHIFFICHGPYNIHGRTDDESKLTELGRQHALNSGELLSKLNYNWTSITQSKLKRAMETCSLIKKYLPADIPLKSSSLLNDRLLLPNMYNIDEITFLSDDFIEKARIEAGFRKFMGRASSLQKEDSYEIIVGHGSIVHYYLMKIMEFTPETQLQAKMQAYFDTAIITVVKILPDGGIELSFIN